MAERLRHHAGADVVVLGLPRGGIPVAFEVARALKAPLDVWVARKLGAPFQPELGMGAVAAGGGVYLNAEVIDAIEVSPNQIDAVIEREREELERRVRRYRGDRGAPLVYGKTVILVDDGIATGGTVRAAVDALRNLEPAHIVLAVPVAPVDTVDELGRELDEVVAVETPVAFWSIGGFYQDFEQVTDDEVITFLARAAQEAGVPEAGPGESTSRPSS